MALLRFRAWDSIKKEMFKDTFAITESGQVVVVEQESVASTPDYVFVEHLVIMQSTGLFDKNEKEIFEGDILKVANNDSSWFEVVKYDHEKAMFISKEVNLKYEVPETPLYDLFSPYPFKVEVIGNIWEDGDLIDGKKANEN